MGATALDAPFSQLLWIKSAVMTRECEKVLFWSTKSLICSVDYDVHPYSGCAIKVASSLQSPPCCWYLVPPKHTAAMQGLFKLDLSIYWHSRWTSSSDCSASAMGGTLLQWFTWTHVALSATFSISSSFSCDHESPRNHQVWPRAGMFQQPYP